MFQVHFKTVYCVLGHIRNVLRWLCMFKVHFKTVQGVLRQIRNISRWLTILLLLLFLIFLLLLLLLLILLLCAILWDNFTIHHFKGPSYDFSSKVRPDSVSTCSKTPVNSFSLQSQDFNIFQFFPYLPLGNFHEKRKLENNSQTVTDRRIAWEYKQIELNLTYPMQLSELRFLGKVCYYEFLLKNQKIINISCTMRYRLNLISPLDRAH